MLGGRPTDFLLLFLDQYGDLPLDELGEVIAQVVADGDGSIQIPPTLPETSGSVLWTIDCLGIYATGFDRLNATRNWLKVARASARPEVAA